MGDHLPFPNVLVTLYTFALTLLSSLPTCLSLEAFCSIFIMVDQPPRADLIIPNAAVAMPVDDSDLQLRKQVKTIAQLIINPNLPTATLLQFLVHLPNGLNTKEALIEFATREYPVVFQYLLSLPFSHWHRHVLKHHLRLRLLKQSVSVLKSLSDLLPKLSALWIDPHTGKSYPKQGPLTDLAMGELDTHDWFFQLLHARGMEGQYTRFLSDIPLHLFPHVTLRFLF